MKLSLTDLRKYISYGQKMGLEEIEIFFTRKQEDFVSIRNKELEQLNSAIDQGLAIRVIKNKQLGFSYTTSLVDKDIYQAIEQAAENSRFSEKEPLLTFPKQKKINKKPLKNFDKNLLKLTTQEKINYAIQTEQSAYAFDPRITKTESASFSSEINYSCLLNSKGLEIEQKSTACGIALEIVAEENNHAESSWDYQYKTHLHQLCPQKVGQTAAQKALNMLHAEEIATGKYTLLLEPKIAASFLSIIQTMFNAENIQRGRSLLVKKLNKKIAPSLLSICDNPLLPQGLASYWYDGEGIPGKKLFLVKNGIVKDFLYDTLSAQKANKKSNGHSQRNSIKTEPQIGASNLYILPGKNSPQKLRAKIKKGLQIQSVMGLHTADPISGDFSFGATGLFIKDGQIIHAVRNMTIAGNLLELLQNISAIGNDLCFDSSIASPSLVIENISVAGKK